MDQQLIEKVMRQVSDELGIKTEECKAESAPAECASQNIGMTEFVGMQFPESGRASHR